MRLRTVLLIGCAVRLVVAPFTAHPVDVSDWYSYGEALLSGRDSVTQFLTPYFYSFFLFAFPGTAAFNFLSQWVPTGLIPISTLNPALNPGPQWNLVVVPGLLYDLLVKIPLITSDTIIAFIVYKLATKHFDRGKATYLAALWFLNPFVIWVSSVWGMFDTVPVLFVVLALYLAVEKRFELSALALVVSFAMKFFAIFLFVPLLFLVWREGGRARAFWSGAVLALGTLLTLTPSFVQDLGTLSYYISSPQPSAYHYSGLSIWTAFTLFIPFDQSLYSAAILVALTLVTYALLWRYGRSDPEGQALAFLLPTLIALAFYRSIAENFFIWPIPLVLFVRSTRVRTRVYWFLTLLPLLSSITDSLFPYYFLPMAPWIGGILVAILLALRGYRVAPNGSIAGGFSLGKAYLAGLGIAAFLGLVLSFYVCLKEYISGTSIRRSNPDTLKDSALL